MSKVRTHIASMQSDRARSGPSRFVQFLLSRASFSYWLGIGIRNLLYWLGVLRAKHCGGRVISVGNITTGGTGKTPITVMLADWLKSRRVPFAILSRGYRSRSEKQGLVFNSSTSPSSDVVGDEISLLARTLPGVWFGIGRNRLRNIRVLQKSHGIQTFLLDDGFQHRRLQRDLDIVLVDGTNPFGNGWPLPSGSLREPISSLKRADLVVITRTESMEPSALTALKDRIARVAKTDRIFAAKTVISRLYDAATKRTVNISTLAGRKCIAFSGIGNPDSFTRLLAVNGIAVERSLVFEDHHRYTGGDIALLRALVANLSCDLLLTTEKDLVKLPVDAFPAGSCLAVEISIVIAERADIFWGKIAEVLTC